MAEFRGSSPSVQRFGSCRRRSGRYDLQGTYTRANSLPVGIPFLLNSSNCENLNQNGLTYDTQRSSSFSIRNFKELNTVDYISNFNNLTLRDNNIYVNCRSSDYQLDSDSKTGILHNDNFSIASDDTDTASIAYSFCSAASDDSLISESYYSSLTRSFKRRKISSNTCQSDTSDTNSVLHSSVRSEVKGNVSPNKCVMKSYSPLYSECTEKNVNGLSLFDMKSSVYGPLRIFMILAFSFFIVFLFLFLVSFYVQYNISTCSDANNVPISITHIKNNLTLCLIGQENAISVLSDAMKNYDVSKFNFGIIWIVGSVGIGKSKTISLIRNLVSSQIKLHSVYGSLVPSDSFLIENLAMQLVSGLDSCRPNIVLYDEFDDQDLSIKFLTQFFRLLKLERKMIAYGKHMKVFFIISGTYRHENIIESYVQHISIGGKRHNYDYEELRSKLFNFFPFTRHHFDDVTIVPFLPFEEDQLIRCIQQEINSFLSNRTCSSNIAFSQHVYEFLESKNLSLQYIYNTVKIMSNLPPLQQSDLLIISGCKRVHKTVNLLLTNSYEII